MKKLIATLSALTLFIGSSSYTLTSYASVNDYNIVVGYVENDQSTSRSTNFSESGNKYTLDFSCLNIEIKDNKIVSKPDTDKISKVSKSKSFSSEKQDRLLESAIKTQTLLNTTLNDESIHEELIEVIENHLSKTSQMPVISITEENISNENSSNDIISRNLLNSRIAANGPTEDNSKIRLYTSVSGTKYSIWGQTNAYIKTPTIAGAQLYLPDAISLSWDSPWKLSNDYAITITGAGGNLPDWLKSRTRTGGSSNCLAYSYTQSDVTGAYLGATLLNGTNGGHNLFSRYIRTNLTLSYSFSGNAGSTGVTVSPSTGTTPLESSVYFSL